MKLNEQEHLKRWLWRIVSLLWAEHKFNCDITGLRKTQEDVNDNACPSRPSISTTNDNTEAVKKMNLDNRRITITEVIDDVGISFGQCQAIFTDVLGKQRAAAKIVPKLLNFEQKQCRIDIFQDVLMTFNDDLDLLKNVITGDE